MLPKISHGILTASEQQVGKKEEIQVSEAPLMNEYHSVSDIESLKDPGSCTQSPREQSFHVENKSHPPLLRATKDWKVEIACCIWGLGSLAAIAATLGPFQSRPLPQLPYDLSLNALVSLYVIMLKAAMFTILCSGIGQLKWLWFSGAKPLQDIQRFDEASRGMIGAAKLIFTLRGRNMLVIFGCLLTISGFAIDPIAQQILKYASCEHVSTTSEGYIPTSNIFYNNGLKIGTKVESLDLGLQSAINAGMFSPGSSKMSFACNTGNCTFPEYKSIAYCSTCTDISSEVSITNQTTLVTLPDGFVSPNGTSYLNFTLPSGIWGSKKNNHQFSMNLSSRGDTSNTFRAILGDTNGPSYRDTISYTDYPCGPGLEWGCQGYGAAECSMELCIKTYNASIRNGKLVEIELYSDPGNWSDVRLNEVVSTIDMSCVNDTTKNILKEEGYTWDTATKWLPYIYNVTQGYRVNASCMYQTEVTSINSMHAYLSNFFQGHAGDGDHIQYGTSDCMSALFHQGKVSDVTLDYIFKNVTNAMTNYIRQYGGVPSMRQGVVGDVLVAETCVNIRWKWMIFPVTLFLLTLVFFVGMVIETTSRYSQASGSHDFKSSALPLVFTGLEVLVPQRVQESRFGTDEMAHEARQMHVKLSKTEAGWKFVKNE